LITGLLGKKQFLEQPFTLTPYLRNSLRQHFISLMQIFFRMDEKFAASRYAFGLFDPNCCARLNRLGPNATFVSCWRKNARI